MVVPGHCWFARPSGWACSCEMSRIELRENPRGPRSAASAKRHSVDASTPLTSADSIDEWECDTKGSLLRQKNDHDIQTLRCHWIDSASDVELIFALIITKGFLRLGVRFTIDRSRIVSLHLKGLLDLLHIALRYPSGAFLLSAATLALRCRA
jgi:hypothetical protein